MKTMIFVAALFGFSACSMVKQNDDSDIKQHVTVPQQIDAYMWYTLFGPQKLADSLGDLRAAKESARSLVLVSDAIAAAGEFKRQICNPTAYEGRLPAACEGIRKSALEIAELATDFVYSDILKPDQVLARLNIILTNTNGANADYRCGMSDVRSTPYLTFLVRKDAGAQASISYLYGVQEKPLLGCAAKDVLRTIMNPSGIYVECAGGYDAGYLSVGQNGLGVIAFPTGAAEGFTGASVPISCVRDYSRPQPTR